MRKLIKYLCPISIGVILLSAISYGIGSPMSLNKAYRDLNKDKGKDCYIIGKFAMTHQLNPDAALTDIATKARDINGESSFEIKIELVNTDTNKTYPIHLKPVTGSASIYYRSEKKLTGNGNDPYWILKVPSGTYQIRNFICSLILRMSGYHDFRAAVLEVPVAKVAKKSVRFTAQPKQLIYIGDYDTTFKTHICLAGETIYTFPDLKIDLSDNFESFKSTFIHGANDTLKEKLNDYQLISAFN